VPSPCKHESFANPSQIFNTVWPQINHHVVRFCGPMHPFGAPAAGTWFIGRF